MSERFGMGYVVDEASGCWNWKKGIDQYGYGKLIGRFGKKREQFAHRISYLLFVGEIPEGMFVLHRCDNRKCVNPDHLFTGTAYDNARDMVAKGRAATGDRNAMANPEHRAKVTGDNHPKGFYGKKHSEESRKKIGESVMKNRWGK